jgi:hypothetical protein
MIDGRPVGTADMRDEMNELCDRAKQAGEGESGGPGREPDLISLHVMTQPSMASRGRPFSLLSILSLLFPSPSPNVPQARHNAPPASPSRRQRRHHGPAPCPPASTLLPVRRAEC